MTKPTSIGTIMPDRLQAVKSGGQSVELVDVRTAVEFREVHAEGARNIPLDALDATAIAHSRNDPVYVICRNGNRGRQACERLVSAGWRNVFNVEGGTTAWEKAGLPVVRGKAGISLERQVRMCAGFLVLLGVLLGVVAHPYFLALAAFVGGGLFYAGVTDTCGMGMMLAKMPWNRAAQGNSGGACKRH